MSNHPKPGSLSAPLLERHGRTGHVPLSTSVSPEQKDELVAYCDRAGVTIKDFVEVALRERLERVSA